MSELKPCPFCGSARVYLTRSAVTNTDCGSCEAEGPVCETDKEAIDAWNRRAFEPLTDEEREEFAIAIMEHGRLFGAQDDAEKEMLAIIHGWLDRCQGKANR